MTGAYVLRRLGLLVPTLLGVAVIVFAALRLIPGDPAIVLAGGDATPDAIQGLRERYGLDQPLPSQFVTWLGHAAVGDLGTSIKSGRPVLADIEARIPNTAALAAASTLLALAVSLPLGVLAASRRGGITDRVALAGSLLGICVPGFWLGVLLQILFSVNLHWFPTTGSGSVTTLIAPSLTLAAYAVANFTRMVRGSLLEELDRDYVRTARGKGLSRPVALYRHALRNALLPVVTVVGVEFGYLLAGTVVVETVFGYAGIGQLLVQAILSRDFPVVQGVVLVIAAAYVAVNLVVDLSYSFLDPRVTY